MATADRTEAAAGRAAGVAVPPPKHRPRPRNLLVAGLFLGPALIFLGALVVYPIFFTVIRSTYDRVGDTFVGLENYQNMFSRPSTLTAIKNNAIWVLVAPIVATTLGLIFAVLTERVKWGTAFKVVVFMPMAIAFLSTGVIWRLVYQQDPERGLANAIIASVTNAVRSPGTYPGARPSDEGLLQQRGQRFVTATGFSPEETAELGLLAIRPNLVPEEAQEAISPEPVPGAIAGVVWLDFLPGGEGERTVLDPGELGLPEIRVQAVSDGEVVASSETGPDGAFLLEDLPDGSYELRLTEHAFREPFGGIAWLGPTLVTPAVIVSFLWIWAGFAMVIIGAGLAAIPRDVLEAARVDGANEWQVFRRVTVPLLAPVLAVVLVTLVINVLKIFDLVLVIPPGAVQGEANVIALEMWRTAFGARNFGLGSALAVFLFLLVVPAMLFNISRFRREQ